MLYYRMKPNCMDPIYIGIQSTYEAFFLPGWSCDDQKRFSDLLLSDGSWGITSIHITDPHLHFLYIAAVHTNKYFTVLFLLHRWLEVCHLHFFIIFAMMRSFIEFPAHSDCQIIKFVTSNQKQVTANMMLIKHINHRIAENWNNHHCISKFISQYRHWIFEIVCFIRLIGFFHHRSQVCSLCFY